MLFKGLVMGASYGTVITAFIVVLVAMLHGGSVLLDVNKYYEGWLEVALLGALVVLQPIAVWHYMWRLWRAERDHGHQK